MKRHIPKPNRTRLARRKLREWVVAATQRLFRARGKRVRLQPPPDEYRQLVARLTNWQRCRWARAGYPGVAEREADKVRPYANMLSRKAADALHRNP